MIRIYEPLCRGFSHEKVNSGFLYGVSLAFPEEKILVYADPSHIIALKNVLAHDELDLKNLEFAPAEAANFLRFTGAMFFFFTLKSLMEECRRKGEDRIFFLSYNGTILFFMKFLKGLRKFSRFKFTLVLHGSFESFSTDLPHVKGLDLITDRLPEKSTKEKFQSTTFRSFPMKLIRKLRNVLIGIPTPWALFSAKLLTDQRILHWKNSKDFHFISLSPHVTENAMKVFGSETLSLYTVVLPTVFKPLTEAPKNQSLKFAIFGYGNSLVLHNILIKLQSRTITAPYEIRIIGMDSRGTEGFPHVKSPGRPLERKEMEEMAHDIDVFLILYDRTRYRLSCSGSILESLSYNKPILHFENECIDFFNQSDLPIGLSSKDIDQFADRMADMINHYESYWERFQFFRFNIQQLRDKYSVPASVAELRKALEFK